MPRILIGTSTYGGGHVYRDLAISLALSHIIPSCEIIYASGGAAAEMYRREGIPVLDILYPHAYPARNGYLNGIGFVGDGYYGEIRIGLQILKLIARMNPYLA